MEQMQDIIIEPKAGINTFSSMMEVFDVAANFARWKDLRYIQNKVMLFTPNLCREDFNIFSLKEIFHLKQSDENKCIYNFNRLWQMLNQFSMWKG